MAIAYVQEIGSYTTGTGATTHTCTISIAPTTGNHLILAFVIAGGRTLSSVSDTKSNTWQVDVTLANSTNHGLAIASCKITNALTTSDTITLTFSGSGVAAGSVQEFSGLDATAWLDKTASTVSASSTALDSGLTATTVQADELLFGNGCWASSTTLTPATETPAWTQLTARTSSGFTRTSQGHYRIVSATGTYKFAGTLAAAAVNTGGIATYKAAAGGSTVSIAAALNASAVLSPAAVATLAAATALNATATLSPAAVITARVVAALDASAVLSPAAVVTLSGQAALSASATFAAAAEIYKTIEAVLSATATVTPAAVITARIAAALNANANVSPSAVITAAIVAALSANATVAAAGVRILGGAAALNAVATLAADASYGAATVVGSAVLVFTDTAIAVLTFDEAQLAGIEFPATYEATLVV